jgi:OmpA-OmpF porin, OOP family
MQMSKWILALALAALLAAPALADSGERAAKRAQAGEVVHDLSWPWPFGRAIAHDSDGDGVSDDVDACPDTPKGARVDATGCPQDGDGDGVFDGLDMCANTPRGATVDAKGCPSDSDGDGVFDGIDLCAGTPAGAKVDMKGCPLDSDGDGVVDGPDQCPNTPRGATVDAKGCPSDSDGDGVFDGIDMCPNTPAGTKVDAKGCPVDVSEMETQFLDTGVIRSSAILFDTDKATIKPESHKALQEIGNILVQWPQLKLEIGGHTDSSGGDAHNQTLSEARAKSVLDYLSANFPKISASQYTTKGYGETKPVVDNSTVEGRKANRRVEFTVLNKEELKKEVEKRKK